MFICDK